MLRTALLCHSSDVLRCQIGGGSLTRGEHRWFLWENRDGRRRSWKAHVLLKGQRSHERVCAEVDGEGGIDILTKPWDGGLHLFAENLLISK